MLLSCWQHESDPAENGCVCEAMVVFGSFLSLSSLINSQCLDSVSVHFYQGRRVCINSFYYKKNLTGNWKKREKKTVIQKEERGWVSTGANKWQILGQTDSVPEWKKRSDNDNQVSVPAGMRSTPSVPWEPIIGLLLLCGYRRERERDHRLLSAAICYFWWIISNADKQFPTVFSWNVFKHILCHF